MEKTKSKYNADTKTIIFHAMIPTEPEPSVTYTFVTEDGRNQAVNMPKLFIDLGDDFERWYNEERHVLLRDFHHDFMEELKNRGNYYAKLVYDDFLKAWSHKQYYEDLIGIWEGWNTKHREKQIEAFAAKNYQQGNYIQEKITDNRLLILKTKAALYFINQTKAFVKPDFGIPDTVQPTELNTPAPTSTDGKGKKWTPDPTKARMIMNRFDTHLHHEASKQAGKQSPDKLDTIIKKAIGGIENDTSIGVLEKQLTRYVKSLHNQTAKEYAEHYVRQNFGGKIHGINKL